jgi:prepilin-type N-terminal cleavage/methylation domain-containing protein
MHAQGHPQNRAQSSRLGASGAPSLGFTLIELMVVVAIIGILAAVAIPKFSGLSDRAKSAEAKINLVAYANAAKTFYYDQQTYACYPLHCGWFPDGSFRYDYVTASRNTASDPVDQVNLQSPTTNNTCTIGTALATTSTFTAAACRDTSGDPDHWTIHHTPTEGTQLYNFHTDDLP